MQEKQINLGKATESPRREAMKPTLPSWIQWGQQKQSFLVTGMDKPFSNPPYEPVWAQDSGPLNANLSTAARHGYK